MKGAEESDRESGMNGVPVRAPLCEEVSKTKFKPLTLPKQDAVRVVAETRRARLRAKIFYNLSRCVSEQLGKQLTPRSLLARTCSTAFNGLTNLRVWDVVSKLKLPCRCSGCRWCTATRAVDRRAHIRNAITQPRPGAICSSMRSLKSMS